MPRTPRLLKLPRLLLPLPFFQTRGDRCHNREVAGEKAAGVVETAEAVADIAKCVSIVGAVFQVVAITARCIRMVSEAFRGRASLPTLHSELVDLLNCTSRCAILVVDPEAMVDDVRLNHVFRIQEDCMLTLGTIEEQLVNLATSTSLSIATMHVHWHST